MKRSGHIIFILLFLTTITIPFIGLLMPTSVEDKVEENRNLASVPDLPTDFNEIQQFPDSLQRYVNDHFGGRTSLFDLNMTIKSKLSSKPFKDNKLLVGKDGWYFSNFQKVIDDYRAVIPFTSGEMSSINDLLMDANSYFTNNGARYYLLIVPNKHTVYTDKLPYYINKLGEKSRLEQLLPILKQSGINVIDIRKEMNQQKAERQLYFKTDSHWNLHGSFIGYQALLQRISEDFPSVKPHSVDDFEITSRKIPGGDIVKMMGKEEEISDTFIDYKPATFTPRLKKGKRGNYSFPQPKIFSPEQTVSAFEGGQTNLKAVVFKDSYGGYMQQFLNNHFSRTVYVWGHDYRLNKDIIQEEKPDIVIQVIVERYLYSLLEASDVSDK